MPSDFETEHTQQRLVRYRVDVSSAEAKLIERTVLYDRHMDLTSVNPKASVHLAVLLHRISLPIAFIAKWKRMKLNDYVSFICCV